MIAFNLIETLLYENKRINRNADHIKIITKMITIKVLAKS